MEYLLKLYINKSKILDSTSIIPSHFIIILIFLKHHSQISLISIAMSSQKLTQPLKSSSPTPTTYKQISSIFFFTNFPSCSFFTFPPYFFFQNSLEKIIKLKQILQVSYFNFIYDILNSKVFFNMMEGKKASQFILKLSDMMQTYPQFISWSPEGLQVIVTRLKQFQEQVLHQYFRKIKLSSMIRQFNIYGFSKKQHSRDRLIFQHPIFRRGNEEHFFTIKKKSNSPKKISFTSTNNQFFQRLQNAQELSENCKLNIKNMCVIKKQNEQVQKNLKRDLDMLLGELKDSRSKTVLELMKEIQVMKESLTDMLSEAKTIDDLIGELRQRPLVENPEDEEQESYQISILSGMREDEMEERGKKERKHSQIINKYLQNEFELHLQNDHFNI